MERPGRPDSFDSERGGLVVIERSGAVRLPRPYQGELVPRSGTDARESLLEKLRALSRLPSGGQADESE